MKQDRPTKLDGNERLGERSWRQVQPSLRGKVAEASLQVFTEQVARTIAGFGKGSGELAR
jgi:hypothetical protein